MKQAKRINVNITSSTNDKKKFDVIDDDGKKTSIGASGYSDYNSYIVSKGQEYANVRKRAYHSRHGCNKAKRGTAKYYACSILW